MRILVIGSSGQLAKEIIKTGKNIGHQIISPDEKSLDLTSEVSVSSIFDKETPELVINCAAYNQVDLAEDNSDICYLVNSTAVGQLAQICAQRKIKLIHYSSDYVFDGRKDSFYEESDTVNPINVYGKSKYRGEQLALENNPDSTLVLRLSWVYGHGSQNFLYKLGQWAQKQPSLRVVYDQISVPCYTADIAEATYKALAADLSGLYHLTNSGYCSRYEVARYYLHLLKNDKIVLPVPSSYFPTKAERPQFTAMSNNLLAGKIGQLPSWESGVERYVQSIKE